MIIINQDLTRIINFDNVAFLDIDQGLDIHEREFFPINAYFPDDSDAIHIGSYSTEDKARFVLDQIAVAYGEFREVQGGYLATSDAFVQPHAFNHPKVFRMPKDEDIVETPKDEGLLGISETLQSISESLDDCEELPNGVKGAAPNADGQYYNVHSIVADSMQDID